MSAKVQSAAPIFHLRGFTAAAVAVVAVAVAVAVAVVVLAAVVLAAEKDAVISKGDKSQADPFIS